MSNYWQPPICRPENSCYQHFPGSFLIVSPLISSYGSNPLVSIHPEDFLSNKSVFFGGIPDCVMSCRSPYFDPDEEKEHKLEAVLTFLTVLCLLSSIFTVLGFLVTVEKYNYPERPILYFGICYVMVGLGKA